MSLEDYGWSDFFARVWDELAKPGLAPGRVLRASSRHCRVATAEGELSCGIGGRLPGPPTVGDWVGYEIESATVRYVLPRRSRLSRKSPGRRTEEQIVAANVDRVFATMGLDGDFNPRRLERFLTSIWESGASPVVLLNKADLCADVEARRAEVEEVSPGAPVLTVSSLEGTGLDALRSLLPPGFTGVLVGSSGVGKSTLVNRLLGQLVQATREVRRGDDRGRHATTERELFRLPGGALLIDGPGVREIQLWAGASSLDRSFEDVVRLAEDCRFRDCRHDAEPGCAVKAAIARGELGSGRLASYHALGRELSYLRTRQDESAKRVEKQKWRAIHREMRRSGNRRT